MNDMFCGKPQQTIENWIRRKNSVELILSPIPQDYGIVIGSGSYLKGSHAEISAIPNTGKQFEKWSDEDLNPSRRILVNQNMSLSAIFSEKTIPTTGGLWRNVNGDYIFDSYFGDWDGKMTEWDLNIGNQMALVYVLRPGEKIHAAGEITLPDTKGWYMIQTDDWRTVEFQEFDLTSPCNATMIKGSTTL